MAALIALVLLVAGCSGGGRSSGPSSGPSSAPHAPVNAPQLYGVTLDDVGRVDAVVAALPSLPKRLTIRIVFDPDQGPEHYRHAVDVLAPRADVMGLLLDSSAVAKMSAKDAAARAKAYVGAFGDKVAIWEIGNEVNGEWLGPTSQVVDKITAAYDVVKGAGKRTALTTYFNAGCYSKADHEMQPWLRANLPEKLRNGLDYVLVSYYEEGCNGRRPDDWDATFRGLRELFPGAALGFGEVGLQKPVTSATFAKGRDVLRHYYALRPNVDGFVGGYFWWNAGADVFSPSAPLLPDLRQALASMP